MDELKRFFVYILDNLIVFASNLNVNKIQLNEVQSG